MINQIKEVLEEIESRTDLHFFYNGKLVDVNQLISVDVKEKDVFTTLDHIFKNSNIKYKVVGKDIILSVKGTGQESGQDKKTIIGTVVDEKGLPIIGANVVEKRDYEWDYHRYRWKVFYKFGRKCSVGRFFYWF